MATEQWSADGNRVTDASFLARLGRLIEDVSPLIVEHRFYRGSRAPHRFICDEMAVLVAYIEVEARPGDSFHFWCFETCCVTENVVANGKVPDRDGRMPMGGPY